MARVIITNTLQKKINKKFKKESIKIFELMHFLKSKSPCVLPHTLVCGLLGV